MLTDLPELTAEFIAKYNQLLHRLSTTPEPGPIPAELDDLRKNLGETVQKLNAAESLIEQLKAEKNAQFIEQTALTAKLAELTAKLEAANAAKNLSDIEVKIPRQPDAAPQPTIETARQPKAAPQPPVVPPRPQIEAPAPPAQNQKPPPARPNHVELARKLKDVREKIGKYTTRLGEHRSFELSVTAELSPEQLDALVQALSQELNGMMQRYQALSLWKKTRATDGTLK